MSKDGLSLGYRVGWRLRKIAMIFFGPAQLGAEDPTRKLYAEREAKIAEARAKKTRAGQVTRGPTGSMRLEPLRGSRAGGQEPLDQHHRGEHHRKQPHSDQRAEPAAESIARGHVFAGTDHEVLACHGDGARLREGATDQ